MVLHIVPSVSRAQRLSRVLQQAGLSCCCCSHGPVAVVGMETLLSLFPNCPFLPHLLQPAVTADSGLLVPLKDIELSLYVTLFKCLIKLNLACVDPVMYLYFYYSFLSSFSITQIEKFVSSAGPGEEINHVLKELPRGQDGLSAPGAAVPRARDAQQINPR